jgi:hypothetical protein
MLRATTMLNAAGDTTLVWTEDRDEAMEALIQKKMDAGVSFFLIEPRFGTRRPLKRATDALQHRMLAVPDADFAAFVGEGTVEAVPTPAKVVKIKGRAKTAQEAAKAETVAVAPLRGG